MKNLGFLSIFHLFLFFRIKSHVFENQSEKKCYYFLVLIFLKYGFGMIERRKNFEKITKQNQLIIQHRENSCINQFAKTADEIVISSCEEKMPTYY